MSAKIEVLDTTLRDGAQGEGITFSVEDKIKIAKALDRLGIDYIEGGNPASNPKDAQFFKEMERVPLHHGRLCAFGSTRHVNHPAKESLALKGLLESQAQTLVVFGKSSASHVLQVLGCTLDENLEMIEDSIAYLVSKGRRVIFDGEHFFDSYQANAPYALACLKAAQKGGAACLVLCDTNGGTLPQDVGRITQEVVKAFSLPIGIHCHNDGDTAVASTLLAVQAGATHIQGTIAGVGERCGNTNLSSVLPNLMLKMGKEAITKEQLTLLTPIARYIAEIMNLTLANNIPFIGHSAFAHKGGMHIDGVQKLSASFEHIPPKAVGNQRRLLLSDQSGRSGIFYQIEKIVPQVKREDPEVLSILQRLKRRELRGYAYENADSSFALMVLEAFSKRRAFYNVVDYHVLCNQKRGSDSAQAYIKIEVDGKTEIAAAEGDGPVNALDKALRKALGMFFPCIQNMRLKDFSVRVLDTGGTASTVRVMIESTDGPNVWNTVGVSIDIIQACFKALCDAVDYQLTYFQ